jgi:hypothetical protein
MADKMAHKVIVSGCHDCPILENHGFGQASCRYFPFPMEIFIDPFDIRSPPSGCPLLNGGSIFILLEQVSRDETTKVFNRNKKDTQG